jgi:hypothetical protein
MRLSLSLLLLAVSAWAGPERETSIKPIPSVPTGLGQNSLSPSASVIPGGQAGVHSLTLPATTIPQAAFQAGAAASADKASATSGIKAASGYAPGVTAAKVSQGASPLKAAGLSQEAADILAAFAADPSLFPKSDGPAFHDAALALKLAQAAAQYGGATTEKDRVLLAAAALLSTLDPARKPGTLPRPSFTADFLEKDQRARVLFEKLAALPLEGAGISADELKAVVTGQDLDSDQAKGLHARLKFLREIGPFLGETIATQNGIVRYAEEQRATASSALGRDVAQPTDEQAYASFHVKLKALQASPYYGLLPKDARGRVDQAMLVLELFGDSPSVVKTPAAPLKSGGDALKQAGLDAQAFARYSNSLLPERAPTPREVEGFLQVFMEDRGIDPDSARGRALRKQVTPQTVAEEQRKLAGLDPKLLDWSSIILKHAAHFGVTAPYVEALIKRSGLLGILSGQESRELADRQIYRMLYKDKLQKFVSIYPDTPQGDAMKGLAENITTRSGKSIEEELRAGAFLYVDFSPNKKILHISSGRDPDNTACDMLFYVTLEEGDVWRLAGYRQNNRKGRPTGSDLAFQQALKDWLVAGGVPERHFEKGY